MTFLTKIYMAIKLWKTPAIMKKIIRHAGTIIVNSLLKIGADNLEAIKREIKIVDRENISGSEKFNKVFDFSKKLLPDMKDNIIDTVIQETFNAVKDDKIF